MRTCARCGSEPFPTTAIAQGSQEPTMIADNYGVRSVNVDFFYRVAKNLMMALEANNLCQHT